MATLISRTYLDSVNALKDLLDKIEASRKSLTAKMFKKIWIFEKLENVWGLKTWSGIWDALINVEFLK